MNAEQKAQLAAMGSPQAAQQQQAAMVGEAMGRQANEDEILMDHFGNESYRVVEPSHKTTITYPKVYFTSVKEGASVFKIRCDTLPDNLTRLDLAFMAARIDSIGFIDQDGNQVSINSAQVQAAWDEHQQLPLTTVFNGVETLFQSCQVEINNTSVVIDSSEYFQYEQAFTKETLQGVFHQQYFNDDFSRPRIMEDIPWPDQSLFRELWGTKADTPEHQELLLKCLVDGNNCWFTKECQAATLRATFSYDDSHDAWTGEVFYFPTMYFWQAFIDRFCMGARLVS